MATLKQADTLIKNRLDQRLSNDDLRNVRHALYEFIIDTEEDPTDLRANAELIAQLLPYLQQVHSSWNTLRSNKQFKSSEVYQHLMEYLKNCFRKRH